MLQDFSSMKRNSEDTAVVEHKSLPIAAPGHHWTLVLVVVRELALIPIDPRAIFATYSCEIWIFQRKLEV